MTAFVYAPKVVFIKGTKDMSYKPVGVVQKSPDEVQRLSCLFVYPATGLPLTITSATVEAINSQGVDVTSDLIQTSALGGVGEVLVTVRRGVDKGRYLIKVKAVTSTSPLLEMSLQLKVREPKA